MRKERGKKKQGVQTGKSKVKIKQKKKKQESTIEECTNNNNNKKKAEHSSSFLFVAVVIVVAVSVLFWCSSSVIATKQSETINKEKHSLYTSNRHVAAVKKTPASLPRFTWASFSLFFFFLRKTNEQG